MKPGPHPAARDFHDAGLFAPFFDADVPAYVKRAYSPRSAWRERPFGPRDEAFFFRGVEALSNLYTVDRDAGGGRSPMPRGYLNHPRHRSAYLLYFMPLQTAKFLRLFHTHRRALDDALAHAAAHGALRVADLGCGPGTATLALLMSLADRQRHGRLRSPMPPIELTWCDTQGAIVEDGRMLLDDLRRRLASVGFTPAVTLTVRRHPWHRAVDGAPPGGWSLTLLGNVINEGLAPDAAPSDREVTTWQRLIAQNAGGGVLVVEPALRPVAQYLGRLRDAMLAPSDAAGGKELDRSTGAAGPTGHPLHGPCLHAGPCPLSAGRDWCHFSVQSDIPSRLYRALSARLGSVRSWLKFSWLWFAAPERPATPTEPSARLVVSDPLDAASGTVLLCEPEKPARYERTGGLRLHRGDVIRLAGQRSRQSSPWPKTA